MIPVSLRDYYTTGEVARLYNVSYQSICRWAKAGRLPVFPSLPGTHRRYPQDQINALVASGDVTTDRPPAGGQRTGT